MWYYVKYMKKHLKKTLKLVKTKNFLFIVVGFSILLLGFFIIWISTLKMPDFKSFTERKVENSTKIYDRTGNILLYDIHQDIKRTIIPYDQMGDNIKNATIAIEDSEFFNHKGIRISSIIRATVWAKLTGRKVQGGSTITQQLIKNTLLTQEVSITRKIKEWILAVRLEKIMTKEEILALYLNEAPYGGSVYGVEEATKVFFNKDPKDLTLAEAAYLAAIPNGPTYYSPYGKNVDKLETRKNLVLSRMLEVGYINQEECDQAKKEKVVFQPQKVANIAAPHFVFFVKDYLENKYGENTLTEGGLKVTTTIDYELQKKAEEIALVKARENETSWGGKNTAIVVIDPKTGQILAMVGSRDYFDKTIDGNFNVTTAARQPGSSFKPIVYALAFEKGYTEKTTLFDVKTEFNSSCSPLGEPGNSNCYSPSNYDDAFRGPMTLRDGLAQSINIIAVKLLYLVGVPDTIRFAQNLGITTLKNDANRYGLSLVIGGGETTLLDMTSVYGVFANDGIRNPYQSILSVQDNTGKVLEQFESNGKQLISPNSTRILSGILSDNTARTPTFGANSVLNIPGRDVAVKTGTTNDNKDAWTIGYTPSVAVGVWVGNNDNVPMKKGGAALAGPIWNAVMTEALKNLPNESFPKPEQIDPGIPAVLRGFWQGGETFIVDTVSGGLATDSTPSEFRQEKSITNVHTILYWLNKNNPLQKTSKETGDSQFKNWEYGVKNWWEKNKSKYQIITEDDIPKFSDSVHTNEAKPEITINEINNKVYSKNDTVGLSLSVTSKNPIKKVDVFINSTYVTSLKYWPFETNINLSTVDGLQKTNILRVVGVDTLGNANEKSAIFFIAD
ncbi:MAG: PBP1A family penicillin-binding protein [Candidatus Moranbacteria bacterium]|nr:PBP1A family penicillin-binding protein [Candidatus Moranbacteria bacterium]